MAVDFTSVPIEALDSILASCQVFQRQGSFIRGICIFSIEPEETGIRTILKTKITVNGKVMIIPEYLKMELSNNYVFNKETKVRAIDYSIHQHCMITISYKISKQ